LFLFLTFVLYHVRFYFLPLFCTMFFFISYLCFVPCLFLFLTFVLYHVCFYFLPLFCTMFVFFSYLCFVLCLFYILLLCCMYLFCFICLFWIIFFRVRSRKPKGINRTAKVGLDQIRLREENFSFNNTKMYLHYLQY
jgi:hypothetical protein